MPVSRKEPGFISALTFLFHGMHFRAFLFPSKNVADVLQDWFSIVERRNKMEYVLEG
jgi:hypothetical protein